MYAVFEDGSRHYRVSEGQTVRVDYRGGDDGEGLPKGTNLEFNRVLLYAAAGEAKIGQPLVEGMRIVGEVVDHPSVKVFIQKFRRRKNMRRFKGHRQHYTAVRIKHILQPGQQAPAPAPQQSEPAPAPAPAPAPVGTGASSSS